jgi:hypothetical protein
VFVYDDPDERASEVYSALVRKLINWLTVKTGEGDLYEIDTALRPNGNSGLLVSTFDAYANYQQQRGSNTAWTWEHQAMTRARFVLGSAALGERFDQIRRCGRHGTAQVDALRDEIIAMRNKVRAAHRVDPDMFDVKHSPGGMVDVEFVVQFLVLSQSARTRHWSTTWATSRCCSAPRMPACCLAPSAPTQHMPTGNCAACNTTRGSTRRRPRCPTRNYRFRAQQCWRCGRRFSALRKPPRSGKSPEKQGNSGLRPASTTRPGGVCCAQAVPGFCGHHFSSSMNLVQVTNESIVIGQPLPFSLRDETGILLARKGYVIGSRADLESMRGRGLGFYVDVSESEKHQKAFVGKLLELVRDDRPLGKIAQAQLTTRDLSSNRDGTAVDAHTWLDLQVQGTRLLRDLNTQNFPDDLERLHQQLDRLSRRNPDGALFALFHLAYSEVDLYSATHAMLVSVVCGLAAREVLQWPERMQDTLCKAALTMNIGMTSLQDRLATQREPPTAEQREYIAQHAQRSVDLLKKMGQHDPDWLEAVRDHHRTDRRQPGLALAGPAHRTPDPARGHLHGAAGAPRLAPAGRRHRRDAGLLLRRAPADRRRRRALIKAVGVYSPGTLVRMANNETGVVVRRGANTSTPRVAVLVNRDGFATGEHVVRDTSLREFRITAGVRPMSAR